MLDLPGGAAFRPTLPDCLQAAAAAYEDAEYLVSSDQRVSFREAERASAKIARALLALGSTKESRVGLLMSNRPFWAVIFFGIARAGGITVPFSTFYQAPEIAWCLAHTDVETLIIEPSYLRQDYLALLEAAIPGLADQKGPTLFFPDFPFLRRIIVAGACDRAWALSLDDALDAAASRAEIDDAFLARVEAAISPADRLLIICTSGSSGEPKAVVHTHGVAVRITNSFLDYLDLRRGDRNYTGQPFFWIGGLNVNLLPALQAGMCLIFADRPEPAELARLIADESITRLSLWPAQIKAIVEAAEREGVSLASVRSGLGAPRDEAGLVIPADRRMGGVLGMTESFGMHSIDRRTTPLPRGKGGTWGRHLPGVERRIVDPITRAVLPPGSKGELEVRGYTLMQGYYKRDREEVFAADGWFATDDLCTIDADDFLYFHGRAGEMIKTSGANVSPREVELALQSHAGIEEAIVFGVPDSVRGETIVAVIVPVGEGRFDEAAARGHLATRISSFKIPHRFVAMAKEEIPRTGSEKPIKGVLRDRLADQSSNKE
ncbi:class I adenylate-forming enzyme family protein [Sphingopyxis lindanitolerans]|nr:class I adenylate-forming enzyme family protein [Sphingopyxis lindanitolerans]